jgi:hypothetical protein
MEKILLVETDYKNKFPPIGLMKISTYHKNRGDYVEFYKGKAPYSKISQFDRIYITTLFTFYFDETVSTINHYRDYYPDSRIYVGGIAVSIMPMHFRSKIGKVHIQTGQRKSSRDFGYDDDVNIDQLPLDYDILDDVEYKYPAADNFFAYATRGCKNRCKFCAVPLLEPEFEDTNNLLEQISYSRKVYGDRRNILLMDNNVLCSGNLRKLVDDLHTLGFVNNSKSYVRPNFFDISMKKIERREKTGNDTSRVINNLVSKLKGINEEIMSREIKPMFQGIISSLEDSTETQTSIKILRENSDALEDIINRYCHKIPMQRFVDFNQGIDARQINDENMSILSELPLNPFRLAYDNYELKDTYEAAFRSAYKHGVRSFSNYMLYNYCETPEELWKRLDHNIRLSKELGDIHLFSFPMRYAPIDQTDRNYVGKNWTKKQLSAMNVILNVTRGVVMSEDDFFHRAYGRSPEEFKRILAMPSEFIKYRQFFEENRLVEDWSNEYDILTEEQLDELLTHLSDYTIKKPLKDYLSNIGKYYNITKERCEKDCVGTDISS